MSDFQLHAQLAADTEPVAATETHLLLLANDSRYPWLILVPKQINLREIYELSDPDQQELLRVSSALGRDLMRVFSGEKLNVAALGNMVPQLHVHHIVRNSRDAAWPSPIWGVGDPKPYSAQELRERLVLLQRELSFCQ